MASFGHFIKTEREKREWTQTEFGAKIGINTSAISRIENGSQKFSKSKLTDLSELFNIELQEITDLFFADKFAREAFKYKCSDSIFSVAEDTANYLRNTNTKQGEFFVVVPNTESSINPTSTISDDGPRAATKSSVQSSSSSWPKFVGRTRRMMKKMTLTTNKK